MRHLAILMMLVAGCSKAAPVTDPAAAKPEPAPTVAAKADPAPPAGAPAAAAPPPAAATPPATAPVNCVGFADHMVELSRGVFFKNVAPADRKDAEAEFAAKTPAKRKDLIETCTKIGEKDRVHVACIMKATTPDEVRACPQPLE